MYVMARNGDRRLLCCNTGGFSLVASTIVAGSYEE